jgi:hypothetical protein
MKIKNRTLELCQIRVPMFGSTLTVIHVTRKQLAELNSLPVGKEVFLSSRYCQLGGGFSVVRMNNGLQYVPNPVTPSNRDVALLQAALAGFV